MPRPPASHCKDCGRSRAEVGHISQRGLCRNCAAIRATVSMEEISTRSGEHYQRWREGMARAAE